MSELLLQLAELPRRGWVWLGESSWHMAAAAGVMFLLLVLRFAAAVIRERIWWSLVRPRRRPREREHPPGFR